MFEVSVQACNSLRPERLGYYIKKLGKVNLKAVFTGFYPCYKCYEPFILCKPNKLSGTKPFVRKSHFVEYARFDHKSNTVFVQLRKIYKIAVMETVL